ncbi:MAG: hypothetical protein PHC34_01775 [Candidatus Gastranaerophilales bacterium]|nr:hypothetical protein [Candidatus Gastranaerophilales bacterium]
MKASDMLKTKVVKIAFDAMNNKSEFLKKAGIVGILTTAICQITAVFINKDIPKKEKKFMLAQESADGIINFTIFWTLTAVCINKGRRLATDWTINKPEVFKNIEKTLVKEKGFDKYHIHKVKQGYIDGLGTIIGMIGSVTANNFVSPPLRNYAASLYQKKHIKQTVSQQDFENNLIFSKPAQQKSLTQHNSMSKFLNQSKYPGINPLKPF